MKEQSNSLDQQVKKALQDLQVPFNESHWDAFSLQLDQLDEPTDAFDVFVASQLANLDGTPATADWNSFEEKLSASEHLEDQRFDQLVSEQLSNYQAPYNAHHWKVFSNELDEAFSLRRQLYRYKVMEIAIMLLLFLTAYNFFPWEKFDRKPFLQLRAVPSEKNQDQFNSQAPIANLKKQQQAPLIESAGPAQNAALETIQNSETKTTFSQGMASQSLSAFDGQLPSRPSSRGIVALPPLSNSIQLVNELTPSAWINKTMGATTDLSVTPSPRLPHALATTPAPTSETLPTRRLGVLAMLATEMPQLNQPTSPNLSDKAQEKLDLSKVSRKAMLRFGMYSAFNWNVIRTPVDPVFGTQSVWIDSTGFSTGLALALRTGLWEFELGGAYQTKSYRPSVPVQQYGTFDILVVETFHSIHLDIFEIPLTVRRHFLPENPKWDFYLQSGMAANLIMKPIYEIRRKELVSGPSPSAPIRAEDLNEVRDVTNKSQLNSKEFSIGLLDGGALSNNSFYSLTFGFGLERAISSRWNLYMQPGFHLQLPTTSGFGPNQDRFHHFSLQLGARANLW